MSSSYILGRWFADPLTERQAAQLLEQSDARERRRKRHGGNTLTCRLQAMLAHFWLGKDIDEEYRMLQPAFSQSRHARALLELLYGQCLISQKLKRGIPHLERGFRLAVNLFAAEDYLKVMNRHRLLRQLPLSTTASEAETLDALITTARVIERMQRNDSRRSPYRHDPTDTYG